MIQFVSDLRQVGRFLRVVRFPPPNKADLYDMTEILLKVSLNTITPTPSLRLMVTSSRQPYIFFHIIHF